jgi:Rad3-related DNA helicase
VYLAHKLYRDVLVVDEAHNLIPVIQDRLSLTIWQHDYRYPSNMYRPEQIRDWLATLPERTRAHQKMAALGEAVSSKCPQYVIRRTEKEFNGKGTLRGEPEMRDCLELLPVDISDAPPMFWPGLGGYSPNQSGGCARPAGKVAKLVLMSATIGAKDVESLGLGRRKRVLYIDCKSPIPSCNRPILPLDTVSVNRFVLTSRGGIDKIANEIGRIADHHLGEKGVIHATYQLATLLRDALPGVRYMFHDRNSKRDVYQQFRDSDPAEGRILVASGMYEGIDLPEDLGRWQVIAKVPWKSLGDPAIAHLAERNPDWYTWECIRTVIQACGRICRTPEDYGVTYVLDTSFWRMLSEGYKMLPEWWLEALQLTAEQKLKLDRIRADTYK